MITDFSLGKIAVPTPGTLVQLTTPAGLPPIRSLHFQVFQGGTGKVYLGTSALNKSSLVGVVKEFWPTGAGGGTPDSYEVLPYRGESFRLEDFSIDAAVAAEGLIVSGTAEAF